MTESWPGTVLPIREKPAILPSVASGHGVLPIAGLDGKGTVLPMAGAHRPAADEAKAPSKHAPADGAKKGGVTKTPFEKFAEEMAYAGAIANQQFNEDTKHPDGKQFGIPGGKNKDGPNSPVAQAAAGGALVVVAIVGAAGLDKKLMDAIKKKTPLLLTGGGKPAEEAAEKLIESAIAKDAANGRHIVADALHKNGAIGEYSVMAKFTDKLGGQMQAHHILEQKFAKMFDLGDPARIPAVLLTDAEHKVITAKLTKATAGVKSPQALWRAYQEAYADHPTWLAAIRKYFEK